MRAASLHQMQLAINQPEADAPDVDDEAAGDWIAAADGTIDTSTRTAKMATTMHFAMAENELERYRETSAVVHARAIVDKGRHMGQTPFGYRRDADKRLSSTRLRRGGCSGSLSSARTGAGGRRCRAS
jgi:hypothetical protein